ELVDQAWEKHSHNHFRAPTAIDMEVLIKTCLMPLAIKTQNDSFTFVHELKQEIHVDLKYVESLENEIDNLESDKAEFSNMYDILLQEFTLYSWPQVRESSFAKPFDVNAPDPSRKSPKHVSFQSPRESVGSNDMVYNYYLKEAKKSDFGLPTVRIPLLDGKMLKVLGERPEEKVRQLMSAKAKKNKQEEMVVVSDFPKVFLDDLSGLLPIREIKFQIEIILGAMLVVKSPYRLAPFEMEELSGQPKELQDKGFIRQSSSLGVHRCYTLRRKMVLLGCALTIRN
nr:putative reverse transcriptase domain-containing protein [Tanacetum cinerariifolium]